MEQFYKTIRRPEYTGQNRCIPCTVINVVIAAIVSGLVGLVSTPVAVAIFVFFVGVISVRGYLVPGTPALTKTYFPDWVLRWFDKEPMPDYAVPVNGELGDEFAVETALLSAGALEEASNPDELYLAPDFRTEWDREMERLDQDEASRILASMLGIPVNRITSEDRGKSYVVKVGDTTAGKWESDQAFVADMAAEHVFENQVENWTDFSVERRSGLLRGLRVYIEQCPRCGGTVTLTEETVVSCCRSRQVFACACHECSARLFEIAASEVKNLDG